MNGNLPAAMKTAEAGVNSNARSKSGTSQSPFFIKRFGDITIKDVPTVGGKTASLGEMFCELAPPVLVVRGDEE